MTRKFTTIALIASMTFATTAPVAKAMENEISMLAGNVYRTLTKHGISTDGMMDLSLSQLGRINSCKNSGESEAKIANCIRAAAGAN